MFRFVSSLLGNRKNAPARRSAPTPRRVRLGVEVLEGRALPSVSPIMTGVVSNLGAAQFTTIYQQAPVVDVANLTGVTFTLASSTGKATHTLTILTETYNANGSATFTASWQGDGPNAHTITGTLSFNSQGNLQLYGTWTNGQGGTNILSGTITKVTDPGIAGDTIYGYHWSFSGSVTVTGAGGTGPGNVSGNGYPVINLLHAL